MIAYNNKWLGNLLIREEAEKAFRKQYISREEIGNIEKAYPAGFYTPNFFVRIGLFILTIVISLFSLGIFLLLFSSAGEQAIGGMLVFFGFLLYAALELMVSRNHFRSGVDDALLWMAGICIVSGLNIMGNISWLTNAIIIFILSFLLFLRFVNIIMAVIANLSLISILFLSFIRLGETARNFSPFVIMITVVVLYLLVRHESKKERWRLYGDGLLVISVSLLVCFYLAGNYFSVREASQALFGFATDREAGIPFGWLFWFSTFAIPITYIVTGIKKKDVVFLRTGLVLVAAIVFTVRYYFHVMPIETAAALCGIILIIAAYTLLKWLHQPKHGFTSEKNPDAPAVDKLRLESLIIAQTFAGGPSAPDEGIQFGGGTGGGGGATGNF
jgi:hypothetical protein